MMSKLVKSLLFKAFTLIELLVVIAIIAMLAALLMPALRTAKETSKQIACSSQLKQFGYAVSMYVGTNSEWLPYGKTNGQLWDYLLMPDLNYNNNIFEAQTIPYYSVFHCPAGKDENYFNILKYRFRGYAYNFNCTPPLGSGVRINRISRPSALALISDASYGAAQNFSDGPTFAASVHAAYVDSAAYTNFAYRHSGRLNILHSDTHVSGYGKGAYRVAADNWVPENTEWYNY